MDAGILAWIIPIATLFGGAIGWFFRQYWQYLATKREAALDAGTILNEKKVLIEEMMAKIDDASQKEELRLQLDEVNTALLGLSSERLRRTLKDAGLPPEEALIADGLNQLKPQQVTQLEREIAEVEGLPPSDSIRELHTLAASYYYAGKYQDAKDTYDRILELNPNNPDTLDNRGTTYLKLERNNEALADYNRSLELRPDDPDFLYNRGTTYLKLKRYDEALADYNRSLELRPDHPNTLNNRGNTYIGLKQYEDAIADLNRSLKFWEHPIALYTRGTAYHKLGRYEEALNDFNHSLEIKSDSPDIINDRGLAYQKLERYEEALADYNRSLELRPDDPSVLYNLACLFSLRCKTDDAIDYLKRAIDKDDKYRVMAKTDKDFDNIRDDIRFKKLIEPD